MPDYIAAAERLWAFVDRHKLFQAGFTILTPLPGTTFFEEQRPRLRALKWSQYDMHHVLWEPRLGAKRFFELYAETWRRSILNTSGEKRWIDWMRQIKPSEIPYLTRVLMRTRSSVRSMRRTADRSNTCAPAAEAVRRRPTHAR